MVKTLFALSLFATFTMRAEVVTVFAASSLSDALNEISALYSKQSDDKVVFNFAASGVLSRQIVEGAPADIFFSADEAKADALEERGLLAPGTRISRLGNTLVCVVPADSSLVITNAERLGQPDVRRIALGNVRTVPAGAYAKSYLERKHVWSQVREKIIPCESVRGVPAAVGSGNVDTGIVHKTDVGASTQVKLAFEVPAADTPAIKYQFMDDKER